MSIPITRSPSSRPRSIPSVVALALAAFLVLTGFAAATPEPTLAAATLVPRCTGVPLRTAASVTATTKVRLSLSSKVVYVAIPAGGHWRTTCAGVTRSASSWYRIVSVNGHSVRSLYGVSYLYAPTSLLRVIPTQTTLYAACNGATLRVSASTGATMKGRLPAGAKVVTYGSVSGSSWTTSCGGTSTTGTAWYRIISVNGKSAAALYGTSAVYGVRNHFTAAQAAVPPPAPTPTPTPTPIPTPNPSASVDPNIVPTPTPVPTATPAPTPTPLYLQGIDVSHWQGTIDWSRVAASGKRFAFLKASQGDWYTDPNYATNRAGAYANGILVGAYDFMDPTTTPGAAVAEAGLFVRTARPAPGDLLPVLDVEITGGLGPTALTAYVQAWLGEVYRLTGVRAMVYVSPSFWGRALTNTTWFAAHGYPVLWIAHWTTASSPTVPAANWGGYAWTFWQYTSDGTVPGISGRVDLDRYLYNDFAMVQVR